MKDLAVLPAPVVLEPAAVARVPSRAADLVTLTKPRILFMALATVAAAAVTASNGDVPWGRLLHALAGTALVAAGASALNQWLERDVDALMGRTRNRPLPAGRMAPAEALAFGVLAAAAGTAWLLAAVGALAGLLAVSTLAAYVFVYTPLKRVTTLNTAVGAVPGALPVLIGWAAVRGTLEPPAWGLFGIVFLWQFPHFLAIARMYREEYAAAGLRMLPSADGPEGGMTGRQALNYCCALLPVSLTPALAGVAGPVYFLGALLLGAAYLGFAARFAAAESVTNARRLLRVSVAYLPLLLMLLMLDRP